MKILPNSENGIPLYSFCDSLIAWESYAAKKTGVHRTENEGLLHGKRGILQKFTHALRTENPTFSVRFRIAEYKYSFHCTVVFLRRRRCAHSDCVALW